MSEFDWTLFSIVSISRGSEAEKRIASSWRSIFEIPDGKLITGKVGKDLNLEEAKNAARFCGLNILSQLKKICGGDLNKVKSCIKLTGYVNSTDDFKQQPQVINGASELISSVFENTGKHTRAAVSVNSLPLGAAVEIDGIFEI